MAVDSHKNFAYSTVLTAPSPASSGTSLVVQSGDGTKFPSVSFNATVWPAGAQPTTANAEIVRVTAISTDTFTITRAQESSSARSIVVGDQIAATVTNKTLTDAEVSATDSSVTFTDITTGNVSTSQHGFFPKLDNTATHFIDMTGSQRALAVADMPTGSLVQMAFSSTSAVATGTTVMPSDDTIPQNTEGDQYMTVSITPKSSSNILIIQSLLMFANSTVQIISGALFQDSTANALAAIGDTAYLVGAPKQMLLTHKMTAGTTSSTTFKFRAGTQSTGTLTVNGVAGGRYYGGVAESSMTVWEIKG